jgi:hypothetical protein
MKHIVDITKFKIDENIRNNFKKHYHHYMKIHCKHEKQHKLQRINKKNKT